MSASPKPQADEYTTGQVDIASDPYGSAWVSANAGSGKTYVLTRRVVRLLLAGYDPSRLLCLTFTKAAAGEMSNRVFRDLGIWATAPEDDLRELLEDVEGKRPTDEHLKRARTLFALALETPGGLKIQTIHAFCEALLHQFPLEANVPGSFSVMDDAQQKKLLDNARRDLITQARRDDKGAIGSAFSKILAAASDAAVDMALSEVVSKRDDLVAWLRKTGGPQAAMQQARARFQFSPEDTVEHLQSVGIDGSLFPEEKLDRIAEFGRDDGNPNGLNAGLADRIDVYLNASDTGERFEALRLIFLNNEGEARKFSRFATKAVKEAFPDLGEPLAAEAERLITAEQRIATLRIIENTEPLLVFAQAMLDRYQLAKRNRGLLDFDDLVARTCDLLSSSTARSWVLYKLDLGIDHILLDEAQDTSPRQWTVIRELVEEFFAGKGGREVRRTVFAVGDEKQSIYSFQGAEPRLFDEHRRRFARLAEGAGSKLAEARLGLSFRSTHDVLAAVDKVFSDPENATGLTFGGDYQKHAPARRNAPGTVELWPFETARSRDGPENWAAPPEVEDVRHQAARLAERIADDIKRQLDGGRHKASGAPIQPGDFIVLVRSRQDVFSVTLTRALKDHGIPVAGADRLTLTDHIAVLDLVALGRVMLTPEDDLSLASLLKSPLFGMKEDDLLRLARHRLDTEHEQSLFEALGELSEEESFSSAFEKLTDWRKRADAMPVYEFYAQILGADGGRRQYRQRLGPEAEDVLDAFLAIPLSHERNGLPGLQAFLEDLTEEQPQIKREFDSEAGEVRIMTVHAAKGLEAEIVYLVDKGNAAFHGRHAPALYLWGERDAEHGWLWVPGKSEHGDATETLLEEERRKGEEEYRRLLYVAMTRAKEKLVVCGHCGKPNDNGDLPISDPNWHHMVSNALEDDWVTQEDDNNTIRQIWTARDSPVARPSRHEDEAKEPATKSHTLPAWAHHKLPAERALPRPLNPSGAQALIEESLAEAQIAPSLLEITDGEDFGALARKRGTAVHLLLQVLPDIPENERRERGLAWLAKQLPEFSDSARDDLLASVEQVFADPALQPLFDPATSRAEVPVMGRIDLASGPRPVSGTIDRIAVLDDRVILADFKTSAMVPERVEDVPNDYITQMALYRSLTERLYPGRPTTVWLIWTRKAGSPAIISLPDAMMDEALASITAL